MYIIFEFISIARATAAEGSENTDIIESPICLTIKPSLFSSIIGIRS